MASRICNASTEEAEAKIFQVQGHLVSYQDFISKQEKGEWKQQGGFRDRIKWGLQTGIINDDGGWEMIFEWQLCTSTKQKQKVDI